jgi:hypothetical protein
MINNDLNSSQFSDDPKLDLRTENEILKLKMQAESGAVFRMLEEIPPEIEYQFLRQIQEFEQAIRQGNSIKIFDFLGQPELKNGDQLNRRQMMQELDRLMALMKNKNILLHIGEKYDPAVIYKFLTDELFQLEMQDVSLPGLTLNFIYEEFHPGKD